jgi:hypothetical protein
MHLRTAAHAAIAVVVIGAAALAGHSTHLTADPPPPPASDCTITTRDGGNTDPDLIAEQQKIAQQICRDLQSEIVTSAPIAPRSHHLSIGSLPVE